MNLTRFTIAINAGLKIHRQTVNTCMRWILSIIVLLVISNCGGGGSGSATSVGTTNHNDNNTNTIVTEPDDEVTVDPSDSEADGSMLVFANGLIDERWDQGMGAYDQELDYDSCNNTGDNACPNIDWTLVNDNDRDEVLQISHSAAGYQTGFFIQSTTAFDASEFAGGNLVFDIRVVSGDSNMSVKLSCDYPCESDANNLGTRGDSGWETVSLPISGFVATGLNLSTLTTGIVIWATYHTDTIFQLDNIRWEMGDNSDAGANTSNSSPISYDGYSLVWQDEFSGSSLNTNDWTYETGGGGWGNNELQYYRTENTSVANGLLTIEAREENYGGRNYTSSRLITWGKRFFKYGRVDIRAKLPEGQGLWPALWMLGESLSSVSWPASGEIDIMEMVGGSAEREATTHGTIHFANADGNHQYVGGHTRLSSGRLADDFHIFSINWTESTITWLLDGVEFHTEQISSADRTEFHDDFFFIFNVAVGGNWPQSPDSTTQFPQQMQVDYIRVFQLD